MVLQAVEQPMIFKEDLLREREVGSCRRLGAWCIRRIIHTELSSFTFSICREISISLLNFHFVVLCLYLEKKRKNFCYPIWAKSSRSSVVHICICERIMAVYFKFKSAKDFDSVSIDGHCISVGNLKDKIVEKKNLGRGYDFDLLISNAQTNEDYTDEAQSIPKNTSILVRRVPGRQQRPIVAEMKDEKKSDLSSSGPASPVKQVNGMTVMPVSHQFEESEWGDEFGVDLYAMPDNLPFQQQVPQNYHQLHQQQQQQPSHQPQQPQSQLQIVFDKAEEDSKIKAFVDASASDWQRKTQESMLAGKGFGRGAQGRGFGGMRGFGRGLGLEKRSPPPGYICHRCGIAGHFIQHCPTNGDPQYDVKKMRPPTGIPKSMLVANPDGSYALPSGGVAILRPNEAVFAKEVEGLPSGKTIVDVPPELRCPLCKAVLKDAVLTSRCCFKSFCDKCIRHQVLSEGKCVCGQTNVLADDLLPNKTLRDAITRLLETTRTTSSAECGGSLHIVQDMESAQWHKPRAPSPSGSGSQRPKPMISSPSGSGSQKNGIVGLEDKERGRSGVPSSEHNKQSIIININQKRLETAEQMAESISRQEEVLGLQNTVNVEEGVQQENNADAAKKRKLRPKRQKPLNGEKERFRTLYEPMLDEAMMPYPGNPAMFGWAGPPYMVDAFGQPMVSPQFPFYGYGVPGPVPCEMLYGPGTMLPDVGGHPPFVPPVLPFQRDGMDYNASASSIMSREEFEARKAELKRKREVEQRNQSRVENGDLGSCKVKKGLKLRNHFANTAPSALNDEVEDTTQLTGRKTAGRSLLPDRKEEMPKDWPTEDEMGLEGLEKKPKASVFLRISFPEDMKERSKKLSSIEKLPDHNADGNVGGGSRSQKRPATRPQDPAKLSRGSTSREDSSRLCTAAFLSSSKMEDEVDPPTNDDDECNYKHSKAGQANSLLRDVKARISKRKHQ